MIFGVSKVVLPVDDQERAKEFWTTAWASKCAATSRMAMNGGSR